MRVRILPGAPCNSRDIGLFESFIQDFGYYAVFLFACIEGEVAVLTAGFLCRQGLMSLQWVIFFAFLGTMVTEQILYFVGRIYGMKLIEKHPKLKEKSAKVLEFLRKYDSAFIFGCRFVYGIRNVSPVMIGAADIPPLKYSALNIPAAFVWAVIVAGAGYAFANVVEKAKNNLQYVQYGALFVLMSALFYFVFKKNQKRKRRKKSATEKIDV
ncbi:MAG: DedA family protein [Alphaproteobacteria bacterium]|nr:DedA family protein [Alphaproteobacteria bacterium]